MTWTRGCSRPWRTLRPEEINQAILEQVEVIKEIKVDREEMMDLLRDKADKKELNGMVSESYFEAVRAAIEAKQAAAAEKFSDCELVWQKAIDDIHNELDEKAELTQLQPLRAYLDGRLVELQKRIQTLAKAVGEPRAAGVNKRLVRDADCVSCGAPAVLKPLAQGDLLPLLPRATVHGVRPQPQGAEQPSQPAEPVCYAEWPVDAHMCHRYCGGSHTTLPTDAVTRAAFPEALKVQPLPSRRFVGPGPDGKIYHLEEPVPKKPCVPCNRPPSPPAAAPQAAPACTCADELPVPPPYGQCECADDTGADINVFWMVNRSVNFGDLPVLSKLSS